MKLRDKEKTLLVSTFTKTAEYVVAILVLGTVISKDFNIWIFVSGVVIVASLILGALLISSKTKDK